MAVEVDGDLLGFERGDAEVAGDAIEKGGIGRADDVDLTVEILGGDAELRYQGNFGFDVATDGTARGGRLPVARGWFELGVVKHGAAHAGVGDHPKFAAVKSDGDGQE